MSAWPETLPPPALNSFQESPPNNVIRSTVDKGVAKVRRRTTADIRPVSFTLMLTEEQLQVLDDFFVTTTFSGSERFDYEHPRTGLGCEARFVEPPSYSEREGQIYSVSVQLEILP